MSRFKCDSSVDFEAEFKRSDITMLKGDLGCLNKRWLDESIRREAISSGISLARLMETTLKRDTVFPLIYNGKEIARFDVRAPHGDLWRAGRVKRISCRNATSSESH